jgi:16S rRNA (cytidine1402-2'-O)-methyltransferase
VIRGRDWSLPFERSACGPSPFLAQAVAGITDGGAEHGAFVFAGFLPSKASERTTAVVDLASETRAVVVLEAPHRIEALATALAALGERTLTVGRELTKQFEDIASLPARDFPSWLKADANRCRGEFVLVLHPAAAVTEVGPEHRVLKILLEELPLKTAVKLTADITGASRNTLYDTALAWKKGDSAN